MNQIRLIPSGCQKWSRHIIDGRGGHFAYCSTLATYIYSMTTYRLEKLIAVHERNITCVSWCVTNTDMIATCGLDNRIIRWSIEEEKMTEVVLAVSPPIMIDWCPHKPSIVAVILDPGNVWIWDTDLPEKKKFTALSGHKTGTASVLRWNFPQSEAKLAVGHTTGHVWITTTKTNKIRKISPSRDDASRVLDLQWDPLSNVYLIVCYSSGRINLIDTEQSSIMMEFEPQNAVTMAAWVRNIPGGFVTVTKRTPVMTLWNVSHKSPVSLQRLGTKMTGLVSVHAIPNQQSSVFLLAFRDGSVGVYDMDVKRMLFSTQPGHSETIFDCRFKPASPNVLATASYDGSVKIWDTTTMKCILNMSSGQTTKGGVLYALSWAPDTDNDDMHRLVTASSSGKISVWNAKQGRLLVELSHHTQASFRVAWNKKNVKRIASTSSDGLCVVFSPSGRVKKRYEHGNAVYGVDWSPFKPDLLCTGCHDGFVRIWDTASTSAKPIQVLKGHTARVFNTLWSPLLPDLIASGSDDNTVRVWNLSNGRSSVLRGHTQNVRALVWSTEIPFVLLSGSWDGNIRIWDVRSEACLSVIYDHHADVYGLCSHPSRPFLFVSSSRDTSLRFWSLEESILSHIFLKCVLDNGRIDQKFLSDPAAIMIAPNVTTKLCGAASHKLAEKLARFPLNSIVDRVRAFSALFDFFAAPPGMLDFWSIVTKIVSNSSSITDGTIVHIDDVRVIAHSHAKTMKIDSVSRTQLGQLGCGKRSDRLRDAAAEFIKLGHLREYCDIMIKLGEWERAIAIAPGVSMQYWNELCSHYAMHLSSESTTDAIPFLIASGQVDKAVNVFLMTNELSDALLVAVSEATASLPNTEERITRENEWLDLALIRKKRDATVRAQQQRNSTLTLAPTHSPNTSPRFPDASSSDFEQKCSVGGDDDNNNNNNNNNNMLSVQSSGSAHVPVEITPLVASVASHMAAQYFENAQPILAACCYLIIGEHYRAMQTLLQGHQPDLAFALASVLDISFVDAVYKSIARRCEHAALWTDAVYCMRKVRVQEDEIMLLAARYVGSVPYEEFAAQAHLRPRSDFGTEADALLPQIVSREDCVHVMCLYAAAGRNHDAIALGVRTANELLRQPLWAVEEFASIMNPLGSSDLLSVSGPDRLQVLMLWSYLGALKAMELGFTDLVEFLFLSVRSLARQATCVFPVPEHILLMQEASFFVSSNPNRSSVLLRSLLGLPRSKITNAALAGGNSLLRLLQSGHLRQRPPGFVSNKVLPSSSTLPSGSRRRYRGTSIVSGKPIQGARFVLEDSHSSITLAEAVMYATVCPFSPLHTGAKINPF